MLGTAFGSLYKFIDENNGDLLFEEYFSFAPSTNSEFVFVDINDVTVKYKVEKVVYKTKAIWISGGMDHTGTPLPDVQGKDRCVEIIVSIVV